MILKLILFFLVHDLVSVKSEPFKKIITTTVPTTVQWFDYHHDNEFVFLVKILGIIRAIRSNLIVSEVCDGVALSSYSIITTGKCLFLCNKNPRYWLSDISVHFTNESSLYIDAYNTTLSYKIRDIKLHPDFDCDDNSGDLAILILEQPIENDQIPIFEGHYYNTTGIYRRASAIALWQETFDIGINDYYLRRIESETFLSIKDAYESSERIFCTKYIEKNYDYSIRQGSSLVIKNLRPTVHSTDYYVIGLQIDPGHQNKSCYINLRYHYEWIMPYIMGTDFGVYHPEPIEVDKCTREYVCDYDGELYETMQDPLSPDEQRKFNERIYGK